ncbi:hypothetical protein J437_LFUL015377 [Ladona fulva]|uniref:DUF5641 domain-containing protein n=1 Tax=Ladona fulva TaxID=123851 RepID=A0A8K0KIB5_LADFU|nr:hypothetical protein J437_LFUL015377 [Ladona fulva]
MQSVPEDDFSNFSLNRHSGWQIFQAILQRIWKRWQKEYHHILHERCKGNLYNNGMKEGDVFRTSHHNIPWGRWSGMLGAPVYQQRNFEKTNY